MAYETDNITCTGSRPIKPVEIASWSVFMLLSFIGNLLIVAVFCRNKTLRTHVHYFITNMAVSDLIILAVVLPWFITGASYDGVWLVDGLTGSILCKFVYVALAISVTVSIFGMIAIAVERFHGILFAMKPPLISRRICRLLIIVTWLYSVAFWTYVCNKVGLIIIALLYRQKKNSHMASDVKKMRAKENHEIARMLISVVLVFHAASLPFNVNTLVHLLKPNVRHPCLFVCFVEKFLPTSYTAINPIIYYTCNENYRRGFRELLTCSQLAKSSRTWKSTSNTEQVSNSNEIFELQSL